MHGWRFSVPEGQSCNQFFPTHVSNRKVVAFMRFEPMAPPFLAAEPSIKLSAVSVYGIHAGSTEGVRIGYLFWSPLESVVDPFFTLFRRPRFDAVAALREGAESNNKYNLTGSISVFVQEDDAVLLTYHTPSKITEALEA
jgi:hypothetical protein